MEQNPIPVGSEEAASRQHALLSAWPEGSLGPTFLTSFTFNPFFFESCLLPELRKRGAFPIILFLDARAGYEALLQQGGDLRHAGCQYFVVPFDAVAGRFHPKVHYFAEAATAIVGSGNLTPSGCGGNLEVADVSNENEPGILAGVIDLFTRLIELDEALLSDSTRLQLLELLPEPPDIEPEGPWFLHSLRTTSLLDQLSSVVSAWVFPRLLLAAPFHHPRHETTRRIAACLGSSKIRIAASESGTPPPSEPWETGGFAARKERPLHAKLVYAENDEFGLSVVGSANLTDAAWLGPNIEAVVVRQHEIQRPVTEDGAVWHPVESFEPKTWPAGDATELFSGSHNPTGSRRFAAKLADRTLSIEFPEDSPAPVAIHVVSGRDRVQIECAQRGNSTWQGPLPGAIGLSAFIEVEFDDGSAGRTLLEQTEQLARKPLTGPIGNLFDRARTGAFSAREQELACEWLGGLIEETYRMRNLIGSHPKSEVAGGGHRRQPDRYAVVRRSLPRLDPEVLPLTNRAVDISNLVDAIIWSENRRSRTTLPPSNKTWDPSADDPFNSNARLSDDFSDLAEQEKLREQELATKTRIRRAKSKLARVATEHLGHLEEASRDDLIASFVGIVRLLWDQMHKDKEAQNALARGLIRLIASGWAAENWIFDVGAGWLLGTEGVPEDVVLISSAALIQAMWILLDGTTDDFAEAEGQLLLRGQLALKGLESGHSPFDEDLAALDETASKDLAEFDWREFLDQVKSRRFVEPPDVSWFPVLADLVSAHRRFLSAQLDDSIPSQREYRTAISAHRTESPPIPDSMMDYSRLWNQAIGSFREPQRDPVVSLRDEHCVCGRVAPDQYVQDLLHPSALRVCPYCQRFLVHVNAERKLWG